MTSHPKGYKYNLSASISNEVGSILEERKKKLGISKSFEVEQALNLYYGRMKNNFAQGESFLDKC